MDNTFNPEDYDLPQLRTAVIGGYKKEDVVFILDSMKDEFLASREIINENKRLKEEALRVGVESESLASQKLLIANTLIEAKVQAKSIIAEAEETRREIIAKAKLDATAIKEKAETAIKAEEVKLKSIQDSIIALKDTVKKL